MINQVFKKRAVYSDFAKSGAQYRLKRSSSVRVSGQNNKGKKALHATRLANQILPKMITTVGRCQVGSQIAQKKCTMSTFPVLSSDSVIPSSNITYFLFTSWYVFRRPHFNRCFYIIREVQLFFLLLLSESIKLSLWKLIWLVLITTHNVLWSIWNSENWNIMILCCLTELRRDLFVFGAYSKEWKITTNTIGITSNWYISSEQKNITNNCCCSTCYL